MAKRYWLKTTAHFFKDSHMIYLKTQKNGFEYIYLWQNLLLKCLEVDDEKDCGFLRLNEKIPYSPELLSDIFGMNIDIVKNGINLFVNLGMIEILENGTIYIESVQKMIGKESESAERVRLHRERKALQMLHGNRSNKNVTPILVLEEKEEEEKESRYTPPGKKIPPSFEEVKNYLSEKGVTSIDPEHFITYYDARGWMLGKVKMKNWHSAMSTWIKNNYNSKPQREETTEEWQARMRKEGVL